MRVYGFDSFEGLPEDWRHGYQKSDFTLHGDFPPVNENVKLIKGWFDAKLPLFLSKHNDKKVSFVHIDCDLYSSTMIIFRALAMNNQFAKDCVIVFDELFNYDGFDGDKGELRAWYDFTREFDVKFSWIGSASDIDLVGYQATASRPPYSASDQQCALIVHSFTNK